MRGGELRGPGSTHGRLRRRIPVPQPGWFIKNYGRRRDACEKKFQDLVDDNRKDGMVYFKRAQAYERVGDAVKAVRDYQEAERLFPLPEWKHLAREGIDYCNALPVLTDLPRDLHAIWQDALYIQRLPDRSMAMTARAALERTVDFLIIEWGLAVAMDEDEDLIDKLYRLDQVPRQTYFAMDDVRTIGNEAAHGKDISIEEADKCFLASERIVRYLASLKLKTV